MLMCRPYWLLLFLCALILPWQPLAAQEAAKDPKLALTAAQKEAALRIKSDSEKQAAPEALRMAGIVKRIYENMLADQPDEALRTQLAGELKQVAGTLLSIKGQSIADTVKLLTPEQKKRLREEMGKPGAPSDLTELIDRLF